MTYPDVLNAQKNTIVKDVNILGTTLSMVRSGTTEAMPSLPVTLLTRLRTGFANVAVAGPTINI